MTKIICGIGLFIACVASSPPPPDTPNDPASIPVFLTVMLVATGLDDLLRQI